MVEDRHLEAVVVVEIVEDEEVGEAVEEDLKMDHQRKFVKLVHLCMLWREKWCVD